MTASPREWEWDAIVVGAGPAGSSAALPLARAGYRVLLLEARSEVGMPVQCAEYVPWALVGQTGAPVAAIAQRADCLRTFIGAHAEAENQWPGAVLNRALFDQHLAARAVAAGATLWTGCRAEAIDGRTVTVRRGTSVVHLQARAIVGADGPQSLTARSMGCPPPETACGAQAEVALAGPLDACEVHFRPEFVEGYGWVFPKGKTANVGVAVCREAAPSLPALLKAFLADLRSRGVVASGPPAKRTGGLIPVGGPPPRTVRGIALLCGDAAGQTHPITGGGIVAAVECGQLAGEAVRSALASDDPAQLASYEDAWRDALSHSMDRALARRRTLCANWGQGDFQKLIRRTWIAFQDYYRDC